MSCRVVFVSASEGTFKTSPYVFAKHQHAADTVGVLVQLCQWELDRVPRRGPPLLVTDDCVYMECGSEQVARRGSTAGNQVGKWRSRQAGNGHAVERTRRSQGASWRARSRQANERAEWLGIRACTKLGEKGVGRQTGKRTDAETRRPDRHADRDKQRDARREANTDENTGRVRQADKYKKDTAMQGETTTDTHGQLHTRTVAHWKSELVYRADE